MSVALQMSKPETTEVEWETRVQLAALYHVVHHMGWLDLIYTHMSARIPGEPDTFLINRFGENFDEVTASSLIKMDLGGNVRGTPGKYNDAGFTIHSGIYKARPDANCVMHTHTRAGAAVSLIEKGLRPISQDVLEVYDDVVYHEYGVPATPEECEALGRSCAKGSCVVLYNHGLLTLGETIPGTFHRLYFLERACELEMAARMMGETPVPISDHVVAKAAVRYKKKRKEPDYGMLAWEALLRTIDRKGFDYRR